jgi:hypothetical protein
VPNSTFQIFAFSIVMVTTAAVPACSEADGAPPESHNTISSGAAATAGPGLPADFPLAPGLSACKPIVMGRQIICRWHGVDSHAVYTFYHEALPKAGYALLPGASEVLSPHYLGTMGFKKGQSQGAVVTIDNGELSIQIITGA